ncbi:hypothetical protein F443_19126 [Phytophthora nicotianae P1569]|uniref:Uncharacterized protein n=1 Tax=Phytophthora nicotianae P1569 TaxID=1317065 RepID=V9E7U0_PHYNI|nr:hypothetical protein F443_19126 [Phytophthora nicotianae P1569]
MYQRPQSVSLRSSSSKFTSDKRRVNALPHNSQRPSRAVQVDTLHNFLRGTWTTIGNTQQYVVRLSVRFMSDATTTPSKKQDPFLQQRWHLSKTKQADGKLQQCQVAPWSVA